MALKSHQTAYSLPSSIVLHLRHLSVDFETEWKWLEYWFLNERELEFEDLTSMTSMKSADQQRTGNERKIPKNQST